MAGAPFPPVPHCVRSAGRSCRPRPQHKRGGWRQAHGIVLGLYLSGFRYVFACILALVGYGTVAFDAWALHWPMSRRFTGAAPTTRLVPSNTTSA